MRTLEEIAQDVTDRCWASLGMISADKEDLKGWFVEALRLLAQPPGEDWQDGPMEEQIRDAWRDLDDVPAREWQTEDKSYALNAIRDALKIVSRLRRYIGFLQGGDEAHAFAHGYAQGAAASASRQRDACVAAGEGRAARSSIGHAVAVAYVLNAVRNCPLVKPPGL